MMTALREVIENKGLFCALYSDRGSHFFVTPKAGERVDKHRLTQVGRAMKELGVQMIPAYSPQARGRSERNFGTWQGRQPRPGARCRLSENHAQHRTPTAVRRRQLSPSSARFVLPERTASQA